MKIAQFFVLLLIPAMIFAAPMDEGRFKSWMKSVNIDGYKLMDVGKDGKELVAIFTKPYTAPLKQWTSWVCRDYITT